MTGALGCCYRIGGMGSLPSCVIPSSSKSRAALTSPRLRYAVPRSLPPFVDVASVGGTEGCSQYRCPSWGLALTWRCQTPVLVLGEDGVVVGRARGDAVDDLGFPAFHDDCLAAADEGVGRLGEIALRAQDAPTQGRCVAHLPLKLDVVVLAACVEVDEVRAAAVSEQVHDYPLSFDSRVAGVVDAGQMTESRRPTLHPACTLAHRHPVCGRRHGEE